MSLVVTVAMIGGLVAQAPLELLISISSWKIAMLIDISIGILLLCFCFIVLKFLPRLCASSNHPKARPPENGAASPGPGVPWDREEHSGGGILRLGAVCHLLRSGEGEARVRYLESLRSRSTSPELLDLRIQPDYGLGYAGPSEARSER